MNFVNLVFLWILKWTILLQVRERRAGALPWALEQGWKRFTMDPNNNLIILINDLIISPSDYRKGLQWTEIITWLFNHLIISSSDYQTIQGLRWNDTPCSFETFFVCEVWKCCANCAKEWWSKSSKEERVRGQTAENLQEQRVKVDKSCFFIKKVISEWLDFYLELWEDSSQRKQIAKLMLL